MEEQTITHPSNEHMLRVSKAWGEEHWIVNKEYCGKKLILKKQHRCSFHGHKKKDETFYIISGKVLMELGNSKGQIMKSWVMMTGDIQHIPIGLYHRFTGLEDSDIIEFSTTHDDDDSYRVEAMLSGKVNDEEFRKINHG